MSEPLSGKTVAIIGTGADFDRAIAVACAEAGADIALGTVDRSQTQDFAMNSIANEIWSIGREHFVRVMDATEATAVAAFAEETVDCLQRCDVFIAAHDLSGAVETQQLSEDEWDAVLLVNLTAPFIAAQAFGRLMERDGGGMILLVAHERSDGDAAYCAAKAGLRGVAERLSRDWADANVRIEVVQSPAADAAPVIARALGQ
jgi:2-deoxy-D-gluconate 3-dehydrogenase